ERHLAKVNVARSNRVTRFRRWKKSTISKSIKRNYLVYSQKWLKIPQLVVQLIPELASQNCWSSFG
ncbi:hypothetical protein QT970_14965, partial [Microcoleus sp. herbarium8]|uniref:hypothetical protein n=1 Tax=Microcoleus sp. herbarium8 TaxID=3055436 RepID=UPI002FD082B2